MTALCPQDEKMPTPSLFIKLSKQALPYKWHYIGLTGIAFVLILIGLLVTVKFEINFFPIIGVGFITMIWGWGFFLIINWYSKESKFSLKLPNFLRSGFSWYAALFLDVWFLVGSIGGLQFIWSSFSK